MDEREMDALADRLAHLVRRESSLHEAEHRRDMFGPLSDLPFGPDEDAELSQAGSAITDALRRLADAGVPLEDFFRDRVWPRLQDLQGAN